MNRFNSMLRTGAHRWRGRPTQAAAFAVLAAISLIQQAHADGPTRYHVMQPETGGVKPRAYITSVTRTQDVTLNWIGKNGPYQVQQSPTLGPGATWQSVGDSTTNTTTTVPGGTGNAFFRVGGPPLHYAGSDTCLDCHAQHVLDWQETVHAGAFDTLKSIHMDKNASCVPCHTVGFGQPSGFKDEATTPLLVGVQCENCHGPAAEHAADPGNAAKRPILDRGANVCGGCHTDAHHPNFDEFQTAPHATVLPDLQSSFTSGGAARELACGSCHSGEIRLTLLENKGLDPVLQRPLPAAGDANLVGVTCAVCHDPHSVTANGYQLRNPTHSMIPFSYNTATNTSFAAQYNPNINICGQCHNLRGGSWQSSGRPPHHSPQYNMLIGDGGVVDAGVVAPQSPHRDNPNQCADCHMYRQTPAVVDDQHPMIEGHTFEPTMAACLQCHDAATADLHMQSAGIVIDHNTTKLVDALNNWALTKADSALSTKYGTLAWEYTTPGEIGNPTGAASIVGPSSSEQAKIPDNIKKARYNLYMVLHDNSKGVHNLDYANFLLTSSLEKVNIELSH